MRTVAWYRDRKMLSWAFYDWANSAYATTVMAGFFPVFFKKYWASGLSATESSFHLGMANSLASLLIVACAPILGAIADRGGLKKRLLALFTLLGVVMSGSLALVQAGDWQLAIVMYCLASIGFSGGMVFYDALIVDVARPDEMNRISAYGYALGYLGGGVLFAINVWMTLQPTLFGLADASEAVRLSFILVAIWWTVFSIPIMLYVKETRPDSAPTGWAVIRQGFRQLFTTFHEIRKLRYVSMFLLAYWLYIDGVDTIIRMAVDYGLSLGFDDDSLILALLITQFIGFPAAIGFAFLAQCIGAKRGIYLGLSVYIIVCVFGYFMQTTADFYLLAVVVGLVQGGVQALSRSLYTELIPPGKSAEFFGFYNMLGKFAVVLGPVLMGWTALVTGSSRASILAVIVLFVAGMWLLARVDMAEGRRMAKDI